GHQEVARAGLPRSRHGSHLRVRGARHASHGRRGLEGQLRARERPERVAGQDRRVGGNRITTRTSLRAQLPPHNVGGFSSAVLIYRPLTSVLQVIALTDGTTQQLAPGTGTSEPVPSALPGELLHAIEAFCEAPTLRKRRNSFVQIVRWTRVGQSKAT